MSTTPKKALAGAVAGTALVLGLGVAAVAQIGGGNGPTAPTASVARAAEAGDAAGATPSLVPAETPPAVETTTTTPPNTAAPAAKAAATSTTATTKKPAAPATTVAPAAPAAPTPTTTPAAPKLPPGQRVPYTAAAVQVAASALQQRVPLFKPTDPQLRTFADAVCTSFDQGQTTAQVQATVRDAVSRIQGASLSDADAAFAVGLVTQLRCPGYLP